MEQPKMSARVANLHKSERAWKKIETVFIPKAGELVVYDPDLSHPYSRVKIGDGKSNLEALPFLIDSAIEEYLSQTYQYPTFIDGGNITYWMNNTNK